MHLPLNLLVKTLPVELQPKEELYDLLTLQRTYPSLVNAAGISMHQGIILVGPPGCGKTHLAVAAVGEAGIRCIQ